MSTHTIPDFTFDELDFIGVFDNDALEAYLAVSKLEKELAAAKEHLQAKAIEFVEAEGVKEYKGAKISLRRTKTFTYPDDPQLDGYTSALTQVKAEVDNLNASIKARKKYLEDTGAAELSETKTSIAVSFK